MQSFYTYFGLQGSVLSVPRLLHGPNYTQYSSKSSQNKWSKEFHFSQNFAKIKLTLFNPISAWKPGYAGGGGQFDPPPSKSHVWCPNMTNDTSLESSYALLLESAKKIANLRKLNFLSQNPVL